RRTSSPTSPRTVIAPWPTCTTRSRTGGPHSPVCSTGSTRPDSSRERRTRGIGARWSFDSRARASRWPGPSIGDSRPGRSERSPACRRAPFTTWSPCSLPSPTKRRAQRRAAPNADRHSTPTSHPGFAIMNTAAARRVFVAFQIVLGLALLFGSVHTTVGALAHREHGGVPLAALGAVEAIGALLLFVPSTLAIGGTVLLLTIGIATIVHATQGQLRADLFVYAAGTLLVMVQGAAWRRLG